MRDFTHDYRLLDLAPGCSVSTLRAARRRLVKIWHPDHFPSGSQERLRAEEKIKDINTAFDRLIEHHRNFGVLPQIPAAAARRSSSDHASVTPEQPCVRPASTTSRSTTSDNASKRSRINLLLAWFIVIVALTFLNERTQIDEHHDEPLNISSKLPPEPDRSLSGQLLSSAVPERQFTIGSTIDEVYSIQGSPTLAENEIWHYGKSRVRFSDGLVRSWHNDPDNPLHVPSASESEIPHKFIIGSTKAQVRAIHGAPLVETDTRWDYGRSKVYFHGDRVIGWETSSAKSSKAQK
jgi:hypothetical protein